MPGFCLYVIVKEILEIQSELFLPEGRRGKNESSMKVVHDEEGI